MVLPMFRSTPIIVWFYRGMGAKIGPNTLIATTKIYDCYLLEIGKNCVIGGNVGINGHITSSQGKGILKKVKIGDRVTIGADSIIFAGAVIEEGVIVGACSMVPQEAHLEANSVYAGVPVKKIR
jgi:acetyltransferase-like isoleucine patch superfamily enzyme